MGSGRLTRGSVARAAVAAVVFAVGSAGIFAFAAPFGSSDAAYGATILVRALGCALIGIGAGTLAALACIDRERTGAGLFLALGSVVVGIVGLSVAFPDHRFLGMTVLTIYAAPFAIGYLIATSIGEVAPAGPDEGGTG